MNVSGDVLSVSIRAIKTNHHAIARDGVRSIVQDFAPLSDYCESLEPAKDATQIHLFEMSVMDSGPGFASTWTGRSVSQLTPKEEEDAVRACFGRGSTKGQSRFGEGLPHVLRVLRRQRGFLRLRTGRLSFFLDFSKTQETEEAMALRRYDDPRAEKLAPVSGSLITILIPMRR